MSETENETPIPIRAIYVILAFYLCLIFATVTYSPNNFFEVDLIIEDTRYMENLRVMHISFYKCKRVSIGGEWVYTPYGPQRKDVLLFDRTDLPDLQLELGRPYTIQYFDTSFWRVFKIEEL